MASFIIRLALVAGAVYGTKELGIWKSADYTQDLYEDAKREVGPPTEDLMSRFCCWRCENCDPDVEVKPWQESMVDAWNEAVKKTFNALNVQVPLYYNRFSNDLQQSIDDLVHTDQEVVIAPKGGTNK
ncbi:uncharacterized protein LOC108111356 [Drosophila eugracilis]|uniref:uncharacterized protein LOC108111356 n=1 Tax=Drosophila eugracilis TaxID=29029 RepID=UPI001BD92B68|nr:uncharacterized protein LOC108111356 [Drosophila eugracilis]